MRKHAHEEDKRTRKLRRLAERLAITTENAQIGLERAKRETYEALRLHPALQAQMRRN